MQRNQKRSYLGHASSLRHPSIHSGVTPIRYPVLDWLTDKDKRATVVWSSAGFGSFVIAGYYLWLGFTPAFNLGQASLLLLQAFAVGALFTFYFSTLIFFPAWAYSVLGIEIDEFDRERRKKAVVALAKRSVGAQVFFTSTAFAYYGLWPSDHKGNLPFYWAIAVELSIFSGLSLAHMPRLGKFGKQESVLAYLWSLIVLGFFGFLGSIMLYFLYVTAPKDQKADEWFFLLAWVTATVVSAAIGATGKIAWLLRIFIPLAMFTYFLGAFNNFLFPFKGTASAIGIAEPHPVTVIFSSSTCNQIKQALDDASKLSCDGKQAGVLSDVWLLNTLGDRWVIRYGDSKENIIFEGKGTLVKRQAPKKLSNSE